MSPVQKQITDDQSSLKEFFQALGERLTNNELALSDMTYAMLRTSPMFRRRFASFFGFTLNEPDTWTVVREYPLGGGLRIDWALCQSPDEFYLIENKISDDNYHFDEYSQSPAGRRAKGIGLIVANPVSVQAPPRWAVKTWGEFVEEVARADFSEDQQLVDGYLQYVRTVCNMAIIKEIRFDDQSLVSLFFFNNLIDQIIRNFQSDKARCKPYSTRYSFDNSSSGKYFELTSTRGRVLLYPWIGVSYKDERDEPCIGIWFDKDEGWGKPVHSHPAFRQKKGSLYTTYWDREGIWFDLTESAFDKFVKGTRPEQSKILEAFLREIVDDVVDQLIA